MYLIVMEGNVSPENCFQSGKERKLNFDPCAVSWLVKDPYKIESRTEYILIGGSNRECTIYSREGFKLGTVCNLDSWIWCCCGKPDGSAVVNIRLIIFFAYTQMCVYFQGDRYS